MKSAYELAMERLRKTQGAVKSLTDDQKQRLAGVRQEFEAKLAERELAVRPQIEQAIVQGNFEEAQKLKENLERDLTKLREQQEEAMDEIRAEPQE